MDQHNNITNNPCKVNESANYYGGGKCMYNWECQGSRICIGKSGIIAIKPGMSLGNCSGIADCPPTGDDDGCERSEYKGCIKVSNSLGNDVVDVDPNIHYVEGKTPSPLKLEVEKEKKSDPDRYDY